LDVIGVDLDPMMLATAHDRAPHVPWVLADLASVAFRRRFAAIVMAGNVMIYLTPGTEAAVLRNLERHLAPGGLVIAGFQLMPGKLTIDRYDELGASAGLRLRDRYSTWDGDPWRAGGDYAVSVHATAPGSAPVNRESADDGN
jgi:trans-aconitate methyltransferase